MDNYQDVVSFAYDWCVNKWGRSKYIIAYPKLKIYKHKRYNGIRTYNKIKFCIHANYEDKNNTIYLYLNTFESEMQIIKAVIHEYNHYLQNSEEFPILYKELAKKYIKHETIYKHHPHEKRCKNAEYRWGKKCYQDYLNFFNKNND